MKKLTSAVLVLTLVLSAFTGCGNSSTAKSGSSAPGGSAPSTEAKTKLEQIKEAGKIVFVTSPDYAPYEFVDLEKMGKGDEQYIGADVELARYIAQELGVKLEIQAMDFDSVLAAVTQNKCDIAISGIAPKEDRRTKMDFSKPYNVRDKDEQGIMIRKVDADKFKTIADLNKPECKVVSQNASIQQEAAATQLSNAQQVIIAKLGDGVIELSKGKADALIIADTTGAGYCDSYPDLIMSDIAWDIPTDGTAIGVSKGNEDFIEELNKIIDQVTEQGLYQKWLTDAQNIAAAQKAAS